MTPEEAAARTAHHVGGLASSFMLDGATYQHAASLGFGGLDFYFAGRGGVLGDVDADVVAAGFYFFNPEAVRAGWEASAGVMSRADAAAAFASCAGRWADAHLGDGPDWARLAELVGRIVAGASPAGASVFAGWRALPVPADPKHAALHQMNALRELRNARHGTAVLSCGIEPADAVRHRTPYMVGIFGWTEGEVAREVVERWDDAEALTNHLLAADYAALDKAELDELAELLDAAAAAQG